MIRLEELSVFFGRTIALDGLDASIEPGITGVFGPNGSGKSTLLRVIAGLLAPSSGRVTFEGTPVSPADEGFAGRLGYAGHDAGLYSRLTVRENLELFAHLHGRPRSDAGMLLERLALQEHERTLAGVLSAGLKRRAAVARALIHEPDLLLLDEPYANLDDDAAELVSGALRQWWKPGRVALVATHGAKKLKAFAHGGLILKRGRIAVEGSYRERPEVGTRA